VAWPWSMRRYMLNVNKHISAHTTVVSGFSRTGLNASAGQAGASDRYDCAMDTESRHRTFHQLHQSGCFVMPNPWDLGSARVLAGLGFKALATTSAGFAWSVGR